MPIYSFDAEKLTIEPIAQQTFQKLQILERQHLQKALRDRIDAISPDTIIIAEEFGDWSEGNRRIDLLGIDRDGHIVVIELKRDDSGHMELQALRYAAMVSTVKFSEVTHIYQRYLEKIGESKDAEVELQSFLGGEEEVADFPRGVKIVLAAAHFSTEITTTVLWLNQHNLDIRCVRLTPYQLAEKVLLDIEQIIPLQEAEDYQVRVRQQSIEQKMMQTVLNRRSYRFNGIVYNQRRLALAIIRQFAADNPSINAMDIRDKLELLAYVVVPKQEVKSQYDRLYFMKSEEIIYTNQGEEIVVHNSCWGFKNITKLIERVRDQFHYQIEIANKDDMTWMLAI